MKKVYSFSVINRDEIDLSQYYNFKSKSIFTTLPWISYIEKFTNGKVTIIEIRKEGRLEGYLTGLIVRKLGIKIFGSPFSGWGTPYMGFDLNSYENCEALLEEIFEYIVKKLRCQYVEIVDRNINLTRKLNGKFAYVAGVSEGLELDISREEQEIFDSFKKDVRNFIRQFEKKGAVLKEVPGDEGFAKRYCTHLKDVFAKQGLVPTYDEKKVNAMLSSLADSGNITCIEVENPEGESIACSMVLHYNGYCYTWGTASTREFQFYRPNEAIRWHSVKLGKAKGCHTMDMVGRRAYKYKFYPQEVEHLRIMVSRYKLLFTCRNLAQKLFYFLQRVKGLLKKTH